MIDQVETSADSITFANATYDTQDFPVLGSALRIQLPSALKTKDQVLVRITYATTNKSEAINWLTKEQTGTKVLQYLFTQCEPHHCRSISPLQDTPSIKTTYVAHVTV